MARFGCRRRLFIIVVVTRCFGCFDPREHFTVAVRRIIRVVEKSTGFVLDGRRGIIVSFVVEHRRILGVGRILLGIFLCLLPLCSLLLRPRLLFPYLDKTLSLGHFLHCLLQDKK